MKYAQFVIGKTIVKMTTRLMKSWAVLTRTYLLLKVDSILEKNYSNLALISRFFTALILSGIFLFLNIAFISYAFSVNYNTIVNCGKDAHGFFWSPLSSNCKKGIWYNINPFNP